MQSVSFYNESVFGELFRVKVGDAVAHTSPPPPSLHGSCDLPDVSATLYWAVDPNVTAMHLLFLGALSSSSPDRTSATSNNNSGHNAWDKPFAHRKWLIEFPTEVIGCGVTTVSASVGSTTSHSSSSAVIRIVWVSASLSVEVLSFSVSRAFDESAAIVVEPIGTPRSTGPLTEILRACSGSPRGHIQAAITCHLSRSNVLSSVLLTDGGSVWSVEVNMQGVATERCTMKTNGAIAAASGNANSNAWLPWGNSNSNSNSALNDSNQHRNSSNCGILGLCAIPKSEGFLVIDYQGTATFVSPFTTDAAVMMFRYPSHSIPSPTPVLVKAFCVSDEGPGRTVDIITIGRSISSPSVESIWWHRGAFLNNDTDSIPSNTPVLVKAFCVSDEGPGRTVDIITIGRSIASPSVESIWWHRGAFLNNDTTGATFVAGGDVSSALLLASVSAPTKHSLVHSVSSTLTTLTVLWRDRQASAVMAAPSSIASAFFRHSGGGSGSALTTLQRLTLDDTESTNTTVPTVSSNDLVTAVTHGSHDIEHVASVKDSEGRPWWLSFSFSKDQRISAALLFDTSDFSAPWLHAPISGNGSSGGSSNVHRQLTSGGVAVPSSVIPFASTAFCNIIASESGGAAMESVEDVAASEGLRIVSSHQDGLQTFLNLLSDAVNNTSMATTLGGYHELAAAANICYHSSLHALTADHVIAAVEKALSSDMDASVLPVEVLCNPPPFARSRWYVNQVVGYELLLRAANVMMAFVAWVAQGGNSDASHSSVQRSVREALEVLCGALNACNAAGSLLPQIAAYNFNDNLVLNVLEPLLNWTNQPPAVHAVDVAMQLWSLGGNEGWRSAACWAQALRNRHTVMQHLTILQLLESSRTTSSAELTSLSFNVAAHLNALPFDDAVRILDQLSESLSVPVTEVDPSMFLEKNPTAVGSVYRMVLLRRMLPRGSVHHSLLSANAAANSFLPDLVSLKLVSTQGQGALAPFTIAVNGLVADVYVLLARSALGDGSLSEGMRWVNMALVTSRDTAMDAVQRCLAMAAELVFTEKWFNELVQLPLGDSDALVLLTGALMGYLQRCIQTLRTASALRAEKERRHLHDATVAVVRFLIRRHAFGQAARLAFDVAHVIRHVITSDIAVQTTSLVLVEQLLALALSSVECISEADVPVVVSTATDGVVPTTTTAGGSPFAVPTSLRGTVSGKGYFSRSGIPIVERAFIEATLELKLLQADHHLDVHNEQQDHHEDTTSPAASAFATRLLRTLLSARLWDDARTYAELVLPEKVAFTLQCQAVDMLDDPHHQLLMDPRIGSSELVHTSAFALVQDQWARFVAESVEHSTPETNYIGLTSALAVTLSKRHSQVPDVLKAALRSLRPSLLLQLLLETLAVPEGCDVGEVPAEVASYIFDVATDLLTNHSTLSAQDVPLQLSAGVLDRCSVLATEVQQRGARADAEAQARAASKATAFTQLLGRTLLA
ncbi:Hypothetical protein, putative [Bodo saltans]|uniref:Uncharacterized protein n=1 Tax=Bodo saltans TaxID=75058 RepID=A0A0S4JK20_BODSA|nr:Hypothetical protein, putative [Bodo saltans]|eukprot:CUG90534.1 Hypothetical protein, putative [Bodo saltans]